jgi:hypothetical protein
MMWSNLEGRMQRHLRGSRVWAGILLGAALGLSGLGLAACDRPDASVEENGPTTPTDEQREASIAAEQLAALGGPASPAQRALYEGEFQASGSVGDTGGDGGAWELRLLNDYAQLVRPGLGEDGGIPGPRDYRERGMRVVAGALTITIREEACQTPSGAALPYTAHVLFEGVAYTGCARRGVVEGERPTWASVLPELLPAIDACLERVSAAPARITTASALDDGMVSVRIREADGGRRECIAPATGASVDAFEPVSDLDRRAGEGDPEFQRGEAQPRAESCRTVEPAMSPGAGQVGWLIRRSC